MSLEVLDCQLGRVVSHKPGKWNPAGVPYLIGRTTSGQTVMGEMRRPIEGERYRLWGEWTPQKPYQGQSQPDAFRFSVFEAIVDNSAGGVAQYLANYCDGLGPVKARALVEQFGDETLAVLRERPEEALAVRGIGEEIVESIRKHFAENVTIDPASYARLVEMFKDHKVPRRVITSLVRDWGSNAPSLLEERPYILLAYPRIGWKIADSFATSTVNYPPDGLERHKAAIVEALERIAGDGHTYARRTDVEAIAFGLVNGVPTEEAWAAVIADDQVAEREVSGEPVYSLPKLAAAEETIAERLAILAAAAESLPFPLDDDGLLTGQREALRLIEQNGIVILAGAPGTGKTYTLTRALAGLVKSGCGSIKIVAPTGKAAKRAAELIARALPDARIACSTVHRALGPVPSAAEEGVPATDAKIGRGREGFSFHHNESRPIEVQILGADESSMLDVSLGASLFRAMAPGTRVIIVGDPNQLPSVQPGSVLRDLIEAGVPTATLTEVQRNAGRIVRACHAIKDGGVPEPAKRLNLDPSIGDNWIHLELTDPHEIAARIVELHKTTKTFDPTWDMQCISPEKKKEGVGTDNLNRLLSAQLNEWRKKHSPPGDDERDGYEPAFHCGDKVVRTKNGLCDLMTLIPSDDRDSRPDWVWDKERYRLEETDIVNGDMGEVIDIVQGGDNTYVVVKFLSPTRYCRLAYGDCHLIAAYAMTTHKAQGSGFPYVILPVHNSFYAGMWNREMIYTMFSRAERFLVTVGQFSAIEAAIRRQTINRRRTRLRGLVAAAIPAGSQEVSGAGAGPGSPAGLGAIGQRDQQIVDALSMV